MDEKLIRKSSFSAASRLLPPASRQASLRLYAACRILDDLADEEDKEHAHPILQQVAQELSAAPEPPDARPEARVFLELRHSHGLDLAPARHLVATLAKDLTPARLGTEADLIAYAHGAAGTVGEMMCDLLCAANAPERVRTQAADLGIAMQLTNIARDVREDAQRGRRYLPEDWCPVPPGQLVAPDAARRKLASSAILRTLALAEQYYERARGGYPALPPRARLAVAIAAERYRQIGLIIARRPDIVWIERVRPRRPDTLGSLSRGAIRSIAAGGRDDPGRKGTHHA